MSEPFAAPASLDADRPPIDPHLLLASVLLGVYALPMLVIALFLPLPGVIGAVTAHGGEDLLAFLPAGCMGALEGVCVGLMGLACAAAAVGLPFRRKWAWYLALATFALWCSSPCCLPLGGYGLWTLLRASTRRDFGLVSDPAGPP